MRPIRANSDMSQKSIIEECQRTKMSMNDTSVTCHLSLHETSLVEKYEAIYSLSIDYLENGSCELQFLEKRYLSVFEKLCTAEDVLRRSSLHSKDLTQRRETQSALRRAPQQVRAAAGDVPRGATTEPPRESQIWRPRKRVFLGGDGGGRLTPNSGRSVLGCVEVDFSRKCY